MAADGAADADESADADKAADADEDVEPDDEEEGGSMTSTTRTISHVKNSEEQQQEALKKWECMT